MKRKISMPPESPIVKRTIAGFLMILITPHSENRVIDKRSINRSTKTKPPISVSLPTERKSPRETSPTLPGVIIPSAMPPVIERKELIKLTLIPELFSSSIHLKDFIAIIKAVINRARIRYRILAFPTTFRNLENSNLRKIKNNSRAEMKSLAMN